MNGDFIWYAKKIFYLELECFIAEDCKCKYYKSSIQELTIEDATLTIFLRNGLSLKLRNDVLSKNHTPYKQILIS